MFDPSPSRTSIKTAVGFSEAARRTVFGWPDVLRVIHDDETRSAVLTRYRAAGWTPDDFARCRAARAAMADAVTRREDVLELRRGRDAERAELRELRRRIERELFDAGEPNTPAKRPTRELEAT